VVTIPDVDHARAGSDTLSTHALMRGGVLEFHRWGLLERIVAAGTHPVHTEVFDYPDGWSTLSVVVHELRPGYLMQQLASQGHPDLAASLAASVTEHGTREGLRPIGVSYQ